MEGIRSIVSTYDLHAGLTACAEHLDRFGGHRAAAGLSIRPEAIDAFAEAFAAHADAHLTDDQLRPVTIVDAAVPGSALTLGLAEELRRLAPFGLGNPGVTLLLPGCELTDLQTVGEGKHLRFRVRERSRPAGSAIAFGIGSQLDRSGVRVPSTSPSASRRTAGTARWRRSSSCDTSSRARPLPGVASAAGRGVGGWGNRVERRGTRDLRGARVDGSRVISLYESRAFRALMRGAGNLLARGVGAC